MRFLFFIFLMVTVGASSPVGVQGNAYEELTEADAPGNWKSKHPFMAFVKMAVRGKAKFQVVVADAVFNAGNKSKAAGLYQTMLDQQGLEVSPDNDLYLGGYARLGYMYTQGEHVTLSLEDGLKLLTETASRGNRMGSLYMAEVLATSSVLPSSQKLQELWDAHADEPRAFSIADLESDEPVPQVESRGFSECENYFSRIPEIMQIRSKAQQEILNHPESSDTLIAKAHESIAALDPVKHNRMTLNFDDIPGNALWGLLFLAHDLELEIPVGIRLPRMRIKVENTPRAMIVAQIVSDLELDLSCRDQMVRLRYKEAAPDWADQKRNYLPDFIRTRKPVRDNPTRDAYRLKWNDGHVYEGQLSNNRPTGQGVFHFADGATMRGTFEDGVLHGQGKFQRPGMLVSGTFSRGVLNGDGLWTDDSDGLRFEGTFLQGKFNGPGEIILQAAGWLTMGGAVVYQGPFKNNNPHGEGQCTAATLQYQYVCAFHKGELIQVGEVSLLPGQ